MTIADRHNEHGWLQGRFALIRQIARPAKAIFGAIARIGIKDYPPDTQRRLKIVNVFSFLRQTETMQRLTRTRSISLSTKDKDGDRNGTVRAEVSMTIYFSPDE